jgi:hypothetical protein
MVDGLDHGLGLEVLDVESSSQESVLELILTVRKVESR